MLTSSIERTDVSAVAVRPAQAVVVQPGQTVADLALRYHVDPAALRWANDIEDGQEPQAGTTVLIPPAAGALVRADQGELPTQVAARYGVDASVMLDYNHFDRDAPLAGGTYLQIPLQNSPSGALLATSVVPIATGIPGVSATQASRQNAFPYGQCTWYVASRRNVTWSGNAVDWWSAARGIRPEGHVPVANAMVIFDGGWTGHVAIVDSVNADGTFVISEMNYYGNGGGWGRVDQRTLSADEPGLLGFIY